MPVVVQGGVWDMIKTVGRWKGEGWQSLWKGKRQSRAASPLRWSSTVSPCVILPPLTRDFPLFLQLN